MSSVISMSLFLSINSGRKLNLVGVGQVYFAYYEIPLLILACSLSLAWLVSQLGTIKFDI
jgi:hypothetical protein